VIRRQVEQPVVPLAIEPDTLEERAVAQIAIALVACGVAVQFRAAAAEIERARPGRVIAGVVCCVAVVVCALVASGAIASATVKRQ
jgi:hypothetical protein